MANHLPVLGEIGMLWDMKDRHVSGDLLRAIRIRAQLNQQDAAAAAAISRFHLSDIERDRAYCGDLTAYRLAQVYGCTVEDFTRPGPHPGRATFRHNISRGRPAKTGTKRATKTRRNPLDAA